MKPAYFGSSSRPLFGVHQPPQGAIPRDSSVLLCYPGVQEYNMAHWAFRRLSVMLAREGFHVLRFDWSGTGDSWGETADGTVARWLEDVQVAAQELRDASGTHSMSIVGMRLGAAMAATACSEGLSTEHLVLWEPIVIGRRYIEELETLDERENLRLLHPVRVPRNELVGYPFLPALRSEIEKIDLRRAAPRGAKQVAIVASTERDDHRDLRDTLERGGMRASYQCVPEDPSATNTGQREAALLTTRSLLAIAGELAGKAAA